MVLGVRLPINEFGNISLLYSVVASQFGFDICANLSLLDNFADFNRGMSQFGRIFNLSASTWKKIVKQNSLTPEFSHKISGVIDNHGSNVPLWPIVCDSLNLYAVVIDANPQKENAIVALFLIPSTTLHVPHPVLCPCFMSTELKLLESGEMLDQQRWSSHNIIFETQHSSASDFFETLVGGCSPCDHIP